MHAKSKNSLDFSHIKRYWDSPRGVYIAKILPGEFYVTREHEMISTLLGSCIAVCLRDPVYGVGGMNHFKLPAPQGTQQDAQDANYGLYAMELLINAILKAGGKRQHLEARVYGGGNVLKAIDNNIGQKNIDFVMAFLRKEKIHVASKDVGHDAAQQIYFHPISGNVFSVVGQGTDIAEIKRLEKEYYDKIAREMEGRNIIFLDDKPEKSK